MSGGWQGSNRKSRLPKNWKALVLKVKARDGHRCTRLSDEGKRCMNVGTDVDHVKPGDDHSLSNLALLCSDHHAQKSSREGNEARWKHRQRRPDERHPGLS
ncbi:hypothetical protein XF35_01835 [Streptomyces platensis subsp. clarensis]|nr:hypothetical protein [Streptomyces platensis subsp. clarensis]